MSSINYNKIYERLYTKIEAYDFLELSEIQLNDFLCNWLHSTAFDASSRRMFNELSLDDEIQTITFTLKTVVDEEADQEFVIDFFALGMIIRWLTPKVISISNIKQTYGSSELKYYSEQSHLKELRSLLKECKAEQKRLRDDRGFAFNSYLEGNE